jgi:hypothetical protein
MKFTSARNDIPAAWGNAAGKGDEFGHSSER